VIHIIPIIETGIAKYIYVILIPSAGERCVKLSTINGAAPTITRKQKIIINVFVKNNNIFCFFLLSKLEKISTPMCIPLDRAITDPKNITQINKKIVNSPA